MASIQRLKFLGMLLFMVSTIVLLFYCFNLRINLTASMPVGIYRKLHQTKLYRGNIVSFCLPKHIALSGKLAGYLGCGSCPGGTASLLKEVIALPNDNFVLSSHFIMVNHHRYFAPQQPVDHEGRRINNWIKQQKIKNNTMIWVYRRHDPIYSWDSRYFGGVPIKNILGVYQSWWVWF